MYTFPFNTYYFMAYICVPFPSDEDTKKYNLTAEYEVTN